jgi:hypothetical protein
MEPLTEPQGLFFSEEIFLTAKHFVEIEFLPGFLFVALCGSSFGSSSLIKNTLITKIKSLLIPSPFDVETKQISRIFTNE